MLTFILCLFCLGISFFLGANWEFKKAQRTFNQLHETATNIVANNEKLIAINQELLEHAQQQQKLRTDYAEHLNQECFPSINTFYLN